MDIYVRADGEEDYVQLARHHNNVVKSVKVRLPATRYFDFKVFSKSSSMMMPRHMRIQSSPVALATQQGDVKLVYDLIGPTCVAGADASVCALVLVRGRPAHGPSARTHGQPAQCQAAGQV